MQIEVKGHSGCQIEIVNEGDKLHLEKSTYDKKYISRLKLQAEKQRTASLRSYQHIRIPEIYGIEQTEDSLIVKMQYVYSKNFIDYFEDAGFDQISYFIKALKIFVDAEISDSQVKEVSRQVVIDKFKDVCLKINNNSLIKDDKDVKEIVSASNAIFQALDEKMLMPIGKCHGDLTFSNILFNGNNYYLIDFLDSFIESPLLDLVKIRQDSAFGWSQLMVTHKFDTIRMNLISSKIDAEISKYYANYEWFSRYYKAFQVMNFLRVLQYAKEQKVVDYLKSVLNKLLA